MQGVPGCADGADGTPAMKKSGDAYVQFDKNTRTVLNFCLRRFKTVHVFL